MICLPITTCLAISEELFIYAGRLKVIYLLNQHEELMLLNSGVGGDS